ISTTYTIIYDYANGSDIFTVSGLRSGERVAKPAADKTRAFDPAEHGLAGLWKDGAEYTFVGWYNGEAVWNFETDTIKNADITLTAKWNAPESLADPDDIGEMLKYINGDGREGSYTLIVGKDMEAGSQTLGQDRDLTLVGADTERTIQLTGTGALFTVRDASGSLTLGNNITLKGVSPNNNALVHISGGASLTMEAGSKITGNANNTDAAHQAGGIYFTGTGSFAMNGGEISGNSARGELSGGGIYIGGHDNVYDNSIFTMRGGAVISGNTAAGANSGGGVRLDRGAVFTMYDGIISDNKVTGTSGAGGVRATNSIFRIVSGTVYGKNEGANSNTAEGNSSNDAFLGVTGQAQYGAFDGDAFNGTDFESADDTIKVTNGIKE
ncbi:MAG: InlB B-repeat-containing protein, partial [Treponema sp.]|nr:InlB B-repeat-containing protein [Treponema sp.]